MATLKISDVSVGDWVLNHRGFPTKVQVITSDGNLLCGEIDAKSEHCTHLWVQDIHPIPITPEILESNGFEKDNNGHYALKIGGIVAVDIEYTGGIWELSILDVYALQYTGEMQVTIAFVSSIHSLQHALRLAGVEKEINL